MKLRGERVITKHFFFKSTVESKSHFLKVFFLSQKRLGDYVLNEQLLTCNVTTVWIWRVIIYYIYKFKTLGMANGYSKILDYIRSAWKIISD